MYQKTITLLKRSPLTVPLTLLVVCILAYGLLIPTLGYYWDDWPYAWINHMFGPAGYPAFVSLDRPHSAWVFMILTTLFGEQPLPYHLSALLLYWLCALLFWQLVRILWPNHPRPAFWAALLFAVYPGFLGHPNAIIYNHHFAAMALALFSFIGMVKAIQTPGRGRGWHMPAVLALTLSQFSIEYYLGWEAVRPLIIWLALRGRTPKRSQRLRQGLLHTAPYWLASFGFVFWRVVIFKFPTYQPVALGDAALAEMIFWGHLGQLWQTVIGIWGRALSALSPEGASRTFWLASLGLVGVSAGLTLAALRLVMPQESAAKDSSSRLPFPGPALVVAGVGILAAGWPFWLSGLSIRLEGFYSRFTLAFIPWVALLLAALLYSLSQRRLGWLRLAPPILLALMVGSSTGWHFRNANLYRNDWLEVQRYFHQLTRRAPGLTPGTILLVNDMPFLNLFSDNSLTAILNWTYAPEHVSQDMHYLVYYQSVRLGRGLPALAPGLPIEQPYRSLHFSGTTNQLLVVYYNPPGCVRVLDANSGDRIPNTFPEVMLDALPLSDLSLINPSQSPPAAPPTALFDPPPAESWCLYFEEADLAAQLGDWARVAVLGDQAFAGPDRANDLSEIFVFVEGYLRTGQLEKALAASQEMQTRSQGFYNQRLCILWQQVAQDQPTDWAGVFDLNAVYDQFCAP